ncbi:peptide ABC transporter substrate-binding protein [Gemmatimonas sp.]|uniref:peptide ABC transporter substrate-binding protein n=1 Tax=Gemmatimonas sp. TaxID=1962908 RepID=UPI0025BC3A0E|nr:peptide ABC transporter substrate-binding protein [Gemmatimonas sp.]MCA2993150.1 peptide ABC transporter substrate-binding protein [Gemmatimonas sp.]
MPMPMRRWLWSACTALTVTACGGSDAPRGTGASNDLLVIGYDREPDTMNRYATHILEDIESCVVEGLVTNDEQMRIVPLLAAGIPTVENGGVTLRPDGGMDVTWKLRPGVTWHDGVPHTSADVQFTVDAINKGDWKPESVDGFDRITGVDTPDSLTAVVHYRERYAPYQLQFVRGTLPRHVLAGRDLNTANDYNRAPLGTGPYRVKEWKTGEYVLLEAVPRYWRTGRAPKIRQLLFRFLTNTTTRINLLKSGEVHMVALVPWDQVRGLRTVPGLRLNTVVGNGYEHVTLNQRQVPAFADVRVRRALAHAVDRPLLVKTILDGQVEIVNGPIQPLNPAYEPNVARYDYDTATANRLLDEAGWRRGASGVRAKAGTPLAFTLITQSGFAIRENVSQSLQQAFRAIGVDMQIRLIDGTAISSLWFKGEFDAMLHWWQMGADPELTLFFAHDRTPPAGRNINFVNDTALSGLLYASDRAIETTTRHDLLRRAQRRIAELAPEIVLYNTAKVDAVPVTLNGFTGNPTNAGPFWNVHAWEIVAR